MSLKPLKNLRDVRLPGDTASPYTSQIKNVRS